jgi:transcription factor E
MLTNLLKSLVVDLAGETTDKIVDILYGKRDVNEFLISKKMELTINQVRNILYKLSAEGLVSFIRKKDKRKGWYIYYWTLNVESCLVKVEQSNLKKIENLKSLLHGRNTKRFYICKVCDLEVGEEVALENNFTCNECADVYELANNDSEIKSIGLSIKAREKELTIIKVELDQVREKKESKRKRVEKKLEKEKKDERDKARKKRAKEKKKLQEKEGKVVGKKKPTKAKKVKSKIKKLVKKIVKKKPAKKKVSKKSKK